MAAWCWVDGRSEALQELRVDGRLLRFHGNWTDDQEAASRNVMRPMRRRDSFTTDSNHCLSRLPCGVVQSM